MEPATAALIARAAIAAGTNKKVWTGIASVLAALCLPVILAVMCYISIASGGTEHNRAAVHLAFDGGEAPDGMPADYQAYVRQMQESFAELDAILDDIDGMTEGEVCDRYLVKSVFYSLYFGADRVRLETDDYKKFADCFVDYEERTQNIEQEDGCRLLCPYQQHGSWGGVHDGRGNAAKISRKAGWKSDRPSGIHPRCVSYGGAGRPGHGTAEEWGIWSKQGVPGCRLSVR